MPWGAIIGGAAQIAGSLIGSGKRKREERAAEAQQQADINAVRNFQFTNPWKNLENTAEDLTVNQQASNFQAQQTDAALAQGLDAVVASGGGGGGAQAIANAALASKQNISADLAQQEGQNAQIRAQQAASLQQLEAQGEEDLQTQQYEQADSNLALSNSRLANAQAARQQATQQLVGGIGGLAGGLGGPLGKAAGNKVASGVGGGGFLSKIGGLFG